MYQGPHQKLDRLEVEKLTVKQRKQLGFEVFTGAGELSVETPVTYLKTTSTDALTLPDGYDGQTKLVVMISDGGDGTLTPSNYANGTDLTFNNYDTWKGIFFNGSWWNIGTPTAGVDE